MTDKLKLDFSFLKPSYNALELPSKGAFYKNIPELEKAVVHVRPMTSVEEKLIDKFNTNTYYSIVDEIISNCVREEIDVDDLTPGDRAFILLSIRSLSYGPTYEVSFKCPSCEVETITDVNLSDFDPVYIDEDYIEEPITIVLPISKATVRMNILRSGHIKNASARSFADKKKNGVFLSESIYQKALCLKEFIFPENSENAGYVLENNPSNFKIILGIMNRIHVLDMKAIDDLFSSYDHGLIDPVIKFCPSCNEQYEQYAAINYGFFRPRSDRRRSNKVQQLLFDVPDRESGESSRERTMGSSVSRKVQLDRYPDTDTLPED